MSTVQNNLELSRYEMYVEGQLAGVIKYRMENDQLWLMSTEMFTLLEGHADPAHFMLGALRDISRRRIEVLPFCPLAREFMLKTPNFLSLVPTDPPGHFPLMRKGREFATENKSSPTAKAVTMSFG